MLHLKIDGSMATIRCSRIASYGAPPQWTAEFDHWPSIDEVTFREWPDSDFSNIKKTAASMLRRSERDCSVD